MKLKDLRLVLCLLLVSTAVAQASDSIAVVKKAAKPKFTMPSVAEIKATALPVLKSAGVPTDGKDVVVLVDGKDTPFEAYKKMDVQTLKSVSVIKDQASLKKLTTKTCSIILVIETKKKAIATK